MKKIAIITSIIIGALSISAYSTAETSESKTDVTTEQVDKKNQRYWNFVTTIIIVNVRIARPLNNFTLKRIQITTDAMMQMAIMHIMASVAMKIEGITIAIDRKVITRTDITMVAVCTYLGHMANY